MAKELMQINNSRLSVTDSYAYCSSPLFLNTLPSLSLSVTQLAEIVYKILNNCPRHLTAISSLLSWSASRERNKNSKWLLTQLRNKPPNASTEGPQPQERDTTEPEPHETDSDNSSSTKIIIETEFDTE
ncbi:hypothetical protein ACTXT7_000756 [Hymenolepis weldensis]